MWTVIITLMIIGLAIMAYALACMAAPQTKAEREADDLAQAQYLAEWAERQK